MGLMTGDGRPRDDRPPRGLREPGGAGRGPARPVSLVVGFDNSESARRALAWGANVLRGGHGTLHVIYADRVLMASDLPGFARAGMDRARDEKAADGLAGEPVIVVGRSHHATRQVVGSVPGRLLRRSPYPVVTIS
jgi:nucleotide-binding universal stress UspA family protein